MFSPPCKKIALLLSFFFFSCFMAFKVHAQVPGKVSVQLIDSLQQVHNEELKDVTIKIENAGTETFKGTLHLYCGKGAKVATKQDVPIHIEAGKSLFVPAKIYIGSTTLEGDIPYSVQLLDMHNTRISETTAQLHLSSSRLMQASIRENEFIMTSVGSLLRIPVWVSNRGNVAQDVNIVIAYPSELQDKTNKSIRLEIPAFKDTTLYFDRKVSRVMMNMGYMDITVYGVYRNGDYFSISAASVQSIKSNKKFGSKRPGNSMQNSGNYVSFGTQNTFSDNESYLLQAKGDYAVKNGNVSFSMNMLRWKNAGMSTLINDTWLGYEYKGFGIKVGNIVQNGELSYNGRGAEVYFYTDSLRQDKIYAGYLDKSFNLINTQYGNSSYGRAAWTGLQQQYGKIKNNTTISYDEDKYARSKSMLVVDEASWQLSDLLFAGAKAGVATSTASDESGERHESYTFGATLNGNISKAISLSSDNVYASGYYPGTRRGTVALNERINWRLDKMMLSAGYMYNYLNPKYFGLGGTIFRNNNKSSTGEVGVSRSFSAFNIAMALQYYQEEGNWYFNGNAVPGLMKSLRLSTSLSFADMATKQNILLRADVGRNTTSFMDGNHWQFRANFSYNLSFFRFSANIQQGNFYLSEAFQEFSGGQSKLRLNLSPSIGRSFFNNRLRADAGLTYYKDFYVSSVLYNASLNCNLGTTRIFAAMQYNTFASSASYHNLQFGLTQQLPQSIRSGINGKGEINLFVFYDVNGNGVFDSKDSLANGYIASIGKILLVTSKTGRITYSKLPEAGYKVFFPIQKGWYGPDQFVMLKDKETINLQIPLRQTGTLSGKINYEFNEVYSYATTKELAGQSIIATNAEGKTYEAKTDDNGLFVFYLPTGIYTLTVSNLPAQIEVVPTGDNHQPITVKSGEIINGIDFTLKARQRKIEVKKFGAN